MPYLRDPDHYTRGVGAIASIDHNRGRRNARVMITRKSIVMDRQKLAQRALGAVPARGTGGGGVPRPPAPTPGGRPKPTFTGPSKMMPQRGKYVGTPAAPATPVAPDQTFVVDPAPTPTPTPSPVAQPSRGIIFTGGGGGGGGGSPPTPPMAPDPGPQAFDPGPDIEQLLTPDPTTPDAPPAPSSDSSSKMWVAVGVAAGLGALFLFFRKED